MTTAQVVKTSVTVNNNSPIQDYVHPVNQTQPTFEMTPGFKPFTALLQLLMKMTDFFLFQIRFVQQMCQDFDSQDCGLIFSTVSAV